MLLLLLLFLVAVLGTGTEPRTWCILDKNSIIKPHLHHFNFKEKISTVSIVISSSFIFFLVKILRRRKKKKITQKELNSPEGEAFRVVKTSWFFKIPLAKLYFSCPFSFGLRLYIIPPSCYQVLSPRLAWLQSPLSHSLQKGSCQGWSWLRQLQ